MKDYILATLVVILLLLIFKRSSYASELNPSTGNCSSKMIAASGTCSKIWPQTYNKDGQIVGDKKYCCQ